jgi:Na+/phosphate symporter
MGTIVLLDLMGGVALLLWGLHMVQSGILRTFGPDLRHLLSKALGNRFAAFADVGWRVDMTDASLRRMAFVSTAG